MTSNSAFVIVVGFDGSGHSQTALNWAVDEARQRSGQLRLVTAWSKAPLSWYPPVLETAAGGIAVAEDSPEHVAEMFQAEALKSLADQGVAATGQVVHNHSPAAAILDAAREADLVVLGSRGHDGFPGLHLGSVSSQIVNHAPCSVLVTRSKTD